MSAPQFGIINLRPENEPIPVMGADFSKIGIITTSEDADDEVFPALTLVNFSSSEPTYLAALGTGYLADAVKGVNAQLGPLGVAADITVVRVAEGVDAAATLTNVIAGVNLMKTAPEVVNRTPRIIICPGYTASRPENEANPVVAALPPVLNALLAVAIVDGPDSSRAAAETWREDIQSERIIPVAVSARVWEVDEAVTRPMSPRIAGLMVRIDNANRGEPFHPIANRPIFGIVGTNRPIAFSLTDGATEGQLMLAADLGIVVRGEIGVDTAIADGGFVYIGTESCAEGELWSQFHQVRGADYLTVKMMRITRQFLGRAINADMVEAWLNSIKFMLRDHKAANDILGYDLEFPKSLNSSEQIRLGRLTVRPKIEPAPVFRVATHEVRRYRPAIDELVATIISRLSATS
ncbi:MAG: phage tail protein [Beijerinckiaceae bacterium]|nr:phage tail protein [Beijerinckiaceae bacterium]